MNIKIGQPRTRRRLKRVAVAMSAAAALLGGCIPQPQSDMTRFPPVFVDIGAPLDLRLATYRSGEPGGTRVIFVHGTPGSGDAWADYLSAAPPGYEFVSIDRPGFGLTEPMRELVSINDQAAVLRPLIEEANGEVILVGHSLGGPIIARAAVDFPEKIGALVIVAGSLDPSLEKIHPLQWVGEWPPFVWMLPSALKHSNRELIALKPYLVELQPRLAEIEAPVFIVHGTKDNLVPYENVRFMQETMTNATIFEVMTLDGANHFLPWNAYASLEEALSAAMSAVDRHRLASMAAPTEETTHAR